MIRTVKVCAVLMAICGFSHSLGALAAPLDEHHGVQAPTDSLLVACSPDTPVVSSDEVVHLNAWATSPSGEPLRAESTYAWSATAGRISGQASKAEWHFKNVEAGLYTAMVKVTVPDAGAIECSIEVAVELLDQGTPEPQRGETERITGRSFLARDQAEEHGYGLYSYLLFGSPATDANRQRYLGVIEAYLTLLRDIAGLERWFPPSELNITYLPVGAAAPERRDVPHLAAWTLDHYDYDRATSLLHGLAGLHLDGPLTSVVKCGRHELRHADCCAL